MREAERLGPVRSLLYHLDRCPTVSVVLADTSLSTRFDIYKIARFVENVPLFGDRTKWDVIDTVREACLNGHAHPVIDPAHARHRAELSPHAPSHPINAWFDEFDDERMSVRRALGYMIGTPRILKAALRSTLEAWEILCGDIDFDSLLVANALRIAFPSVFDLLNTHILPFQHGLRKPFGKDNTEAHRVVQQIDALLKGVDSAQATAVKRLIRFLFPAYPPGGDSNAMSYRDNPQGLNVTRHADNWRRLLSLEGVMDLRRASGRA